MMMKIVAAATLIAGSMALSACSAGANCQSVTAHR